MYIYHVTASEDAMSEVALERYYADKEAAESRKDMWETVWPEAYVRIEPIFVSESRPLVF